VNEEAPRSSNDLDRATLRAGAAALDDPRDLWLVDVRAEPAVYRVAQRSWARARWRVEVAFPHTPAPAEVVQALRQSKLPCALVCPSGPLSASAAALLDAVYGADIEVVGLVQSPRGFYRSGLPVEAEEEDFEDLSMSTSLLLRGALGRRLRDIDLPAAVEVFGEGLLSIQAGRSRDPLPPSTTFRVPGPGRLTIDVARCHTRPRWRLTLTPPGGAPAPLRWLRRSGGGRREAPKRLAVVFDRSAPDRDQWSAARARALGRVAVEVDNFAGEEAPAAPPPGSLNAGVRAGLAEGLAAALAPDAEVMVWAVADTAGDGLGPPRGATLPADAVTPCGAGAPAQAGDLLAGGRWSTGVDIWDPLEEALPLAVEAACAAPARPGAVLVVGASPPNPLLDSDDPLWAVACALGQETSVRRTSAAWSEALALARERDLPVAYLFLEHDRCADEERKDLDRFRRLQDTVRAALAEMMPVTTALADRAGVRDGVARALEQAARPGGGGVRFGALEVPR